MMTMRGLSPRAALLLPLLAGFIGTLLSMGISTVIRNVADAEALAPSPSQTAHAVTGTAVAISTPAEPERLIIPAIGLDANVQSIGLSLTGSGDIGVPNNFTDVAWYNRGPLPGNPGIAIIDGHLDGRYVPRAVFYRLGDLAKGDRIFVKDRSGVERQFVVVGNERLPYNADTRGLFADAGTPQLALITCAGDWIPDKHEYTDRIVVFATLVNQR